MMVANLPDASPYFAGGEGLVAAVDYLLARPSIDLLVIHGIMESKDLVRLNLMAWDGSIVNKVQGVRDLFYELVPELNAMDERVVNYWAREGYKDYKLSNATMSYSLSRKGSREKHIDGSDNLPFYGPITMSVCTEGQAKFRAKRPPIKPADHYGYYDKQAHRQLEAELLRQQQRLTAVTQKAGDAVILMNHPFPTVHEVRQSSRPRLRCALIFDYLLSRC